MGQARDTHRLNVCRTFESIRFGNTLEVLRDLYSFEILRRAVRVRCDSATATYEPTSDL